MYPRHRYDPSPVRAARQVGPLRHKHLPGCGPIGRGQRNRPRPRNQRVVAPAPAAGTRLPVSAAVPPGAQTDGAPRARARHPWLAAHPTRSTHASAQRAPSRPLPYQSQPCCSPYERCHRHPDPGAAVRRVVTAVRGTTSCVRSGVPGCATEPVRRQGAASKAPNSVNCRRKRLSGSRSTIVSGAPPPGSSVCHTRGSAAPSPSGGHGNDQSMEPPFHAAKTSRSPSGPPARSGRFSTGSWNRWTAGRSQRLRQVPRFPHRPRLLGRKPTEDERLQRPDRIPLHLVHPVHPRHRPGHRDPRDGQRRRLGDQGQSGLLRL